MDLATVANTVWLLPAVRNVVHHTPLCHPIERETPYTYVYGGIGSFSKSRQSPDFMTHKLTDGRTQRNAFSATHCDGFLPTRCPGLCCLQVRRHARFCMRISDTEPESAQCFVHPAVGRVIEGLAQPRTAMTNKPAGNMARL